MSDCEHCDASFTDEEDYLRHLRDAHESELGSIDRRRIAELERDSGFDVPRASIVFGVVIVVGVLIAVYLTTFAGPDFGEATDIPDRGDPAIISRVTFEPATSRAHVPRGTDIEYEKLPPMSGPHYPTRFETPSGFYTELQPLGGTVHSLEHGAIVVWYDPAALSENVEESLRAFIERYPGGGFNRRFGGIIAVPTPVENPAYPYVLTAWEYRLELEEYDANALRQFAGEYMGRGPEGAYR